ncbi:FxsA family protein [Solirubrobacter sp. CPCC 204708]|uniref:FxsA family protein n=1 Tax=Solirubrobacter deserti TaxID=2282478 RepID=A0ABT4RMP0_9ACTN|nr:FxsA family protein [Solirubrobacter deserti]MBE2320119.1 FxsA family protein [Solirubrobacter deserti]MDA0139837.1 FxsA family protein [Solirubrobacter deserti]
MPLLLVILFIAVPIAELALLIQVGQAIGVWWTVLILIADALLGSYLLRTQGRLAWRRFNEALASGRLPHREVVDGVLVIFGGVLLLTPGFITDILGLLFLFPPTRVVLRRLLVRRGALKLVGAMPGTATPPHSGFNGNGRPQDIEGSAVDVDPPPSR